MVIYEVVICMSMSVIILRAKTTFIVAMVTSEDYV